MATTNVDQTARLNQRLLDVLRAVFGPDVTQVEDHDSPATIKSWDSLNHVHLMLALEAEFGVQLDADDIASLASVGAIRRRVLST